MPHATLSLLVLLCLAVPAAARPVPETARELPEIVVIANRSDSVSVPVAGHRSILYLEDLREQGVDTVAEALQRVAGIQVTDLFGDGSRVTASLRGFGQNATGNAVVLVDGRRLNNTLDIAAPTLTTLALENIDRIEILHGSGGVLYGESAVGGVINIVTRPVEGNRAELRAESGSFDHEAYTGTGSIMLAESLSLGFTAHELRSDNFRLNNARSSTYYAGRLQGGDHERGFFIEAGTHDEDLRTPGAIFAAQRATDRRQPNNFNDFQDTDTDYLRAGLRARPHQDWHLELDYTWRDDDVQGNLTVGGFGGPFTQARRQWSLNPRVVGSFAADHGTAVVTLGIDHDVADYSITSVLGTQVADQRSTGYYGQIVWPLAPGLEISAGVRDYRVDTDVQDNFTFVNGIDIDENVLAKEFGLHYQPLDAWRFYLRRADNFRVGKVDEHTGQAFGITTPLEVQHGTSWETGAAWRGERTDAGLHMYHLRLQDEIAFDPTVFANRNLDPTRRIGASLEAGHRIWPELEVRLQHAVVDARFRGGANEGERIPFVARSNTVIGVTWEPRADLTAHLAYRRMGDRNPTGDDAGAFDEVNGFEVVDATTTWRRGPVEVAFQVNNLFDEDYDAFGTVAFNPFPNQETAFMPAPGRNVLFTFRYRLGE